MSSAGGGGHGFVGLGGGGIGSGHDLFFSKGGLVGLSVELCQDTKT